MTRTIHGPRGPEKKEAPAAKKLADECLADAPTNATHPIGQYVIFLKDERARSRHFVDPLFRLPEPSKPLPVAKEQVLEAIEKCDGRDCSDRFLLRAIVEMTDDPDIKTAAQKAMLLGLGQAIVGIPPRQ